jgi:uncharacterized protein (TIGR02145 family)
LQDNKNDKSLIKKRDEMRKNLILMMLLLTGAASMNAQEISDNPIMVVTGSVLNTGTMVSKGPIDLRTNTAKDSQINNTATGDIQTPALTVGEFTLLNNEGKICVGCVEGIGSGGDDELVIGDNHYAIGNFGDAGTWMTENLREVPTGGILDKGSDASAKYYNYPDNKEANVASYGYLYSWAAATNGSSVTDDQGATDHEAVQGICPTGWHLPSDYEWTELQTVIGTDASKTYSETDGASTPFATTYATTGFRGGNLDKKMKTASLPAATGVTTGAAWDSGTSKSSTDNGFNALPAGISDDSVTDSIGEGAGYWSSSAVDDFNKWGHMLYNNNAGVLRDMLPGYFQFSVRCKRN